MNEYPCIKCGLCCKRVNKAVENMKLMFGEVDFPYKWDETGRCEMLDENNLCKVYETRPLMCNVNRFGELIGVNEIEFFNLNIDACNLLLSQAGRQERINYVH